MLEQVVLPAALCSEAELQAAEVLLCSHQWVECARGQKIV